MISYDADDPFYHLPSVLWIIVDRLPGSVANELNWEEFVPTVASLTQPNHGKLVMVYTDEPGSEVGVVQLRRKYSRRNWYRLEVPSVALLEKILFAQIERGIEYVALDADHEFQGNKLRTRIGKIAEIRMQS